MYQKFLLYLGRIAGWIVLIWSLFLVITSEHLLEDPAEYTCGEDGVLNIYNILQEGQEIIENQYFVEVYLDCMQLTYAFAIRKDLGVHFGFISIAVGILLLIIIEQAFMNNQQTGEIKHD